MRKLLRLFWTIRHLKPRQIAYQLYYRLTGRLTANDAGPQVQGKDSVRLKVPPLAIDPAVINALPVRYTEAGFCFLHRTAPFSSVETIAWNYAELGKLWTYNLNYFEYLRQPDLSPDLGERLIDSWIAQEATHHDGWEPYPISLRLVNWLQFYRSYGRAVPARVQASVQRQYRSLWRKVEYHLGGNHLLENAIALSLTARYLNDAKGQRKADRLLQAELREQYLPDGAHFELSVMYHLILLWRQLDLYSWLQPNELPLLPDTLRRQLAWADYIITPDGRYPHFNDSTNGVAPDWAAVRAYAEALGLYRSSDASLGLPPSGARGLDQSSSDVSVKTGHDPASDTSDELSAGYTRRKYASDERPLS
ncbi:MAG: heparinase II/III family protein, partial [Bacteroidota bacterium]